jgi:hypothetical protein
MKDDLPSGERFASKVSIPQIALAYLDTIGAQLEVLQASTREVIRDGDDRVAFHEPVDEVAAYERGSPGDEHTDARPWIGAVGC